MGCARTLAGIWLRRRQDIHLTAGANRTFSSYQTHRPALIKTGGGAGG